MTWELDHTAWSREALTPFEHKLNVKPEKRTIAFVEVPRHDYARNGVLIADRTDLRP